jgi:hypothetical protein
MLVQGFLGLRRNADAVIDEPEWIFQDQVRHPIRVHQREADRCHAPGRVTQHRNLPDTEVIKQGDRVGGQQLEAVMDIGLRRLAQPIWSGTTTRYPEAVSASITFSK